MNFHWVKGRYTKLIASTIASQFGVAEYEAPGLEEFESCVIALDSLNMGFRPKDFNALCYPSGFFETLGIFEENIEQLGVQSDSQYFTHYNYYVNRNKPSAPKVLWLGDSFGHGISADLARYFSQVLCINAANIGYTFLSTKTREESFEEAAKIVNLNLVAAKYQPDYIVFETHHYSIPWLRKLLE